MLATVAGEVGVVAINHLRLGPMKRERSKVEVPACNVKVANVWRRSYRRRSGAIPAARARDLAGDALAAVVG